MVVVAGDNDDQMQIKRPAGGPKAYVQRMLLLQLRHFMWGTGRSHSLSARFASFQGTIAASKKRNP